MDTTPVLVTDEQRNLALIGRWIVAAGVLVMSASSISRLISISWQDGFASGLKAAEIRDRALQEEPHD